MSLRFPINSLFGRIFAGLLVVILATGASVWIYAWIVQEREIGIGTIDGRRSAQKAIETALTVHRYGGREQLERWLKSPVNTDPIVYVLNPRGGELSGRRVPEAALNMLRELRRGGTEPWSEVLFEQGHMRGRHGRGMPMHLTRALQRIEIDGEPYLIFATRTDPRLVPIDPIPFNPRYPADFAFISGLLITLIVAWLLAYWYTRPLRQLDAAMRRFAEGKLDTRVSGEISGAGREIATLATVFDKMAERIEQLVNRQRRLFHDVSHEVRSPLARIEIALELARRDPERVPATLDRIEKEVGSIDQLIEGLLTYARLDAGEKLPLIPEELIPMLEEIRETAQFEAQKRSVRVTLHVDPALKGVRIAADAASLARAFDNFLRNALRYTPEDGEIELRAQPATQMGWVEILCADDGPGIPEEEIEQIFNPFVRGTRERTGTGFGLGLAIARRVIVLHGGHVAARNRTDRASGLVVTTTLPILQQQHSF